jgi:hypothetical protein
LLLEPFMADVEIIRNEIADPKVAHQFVDELTELAASASALARGVLGCSILDEGLHYEIEVEAPGWTERVAIPSPARPGAVRGAVEKVLRDLGLTIEPASTRRGQL